MDDAPETTQPQTELRSEEPEVISFADFLESVPPSQTRKMITLAVKKYRSGAGAGHYFRSLRTRYTHSLRTLRLQWHAVFSFYRKPRHLTPDVKCR
jgi:hypothetical protein